jgi:hypothetical protein
MVTVQALDRTVISNISAHSGLPQRHTAHMTIKTTLGIYKTYYFIDTYSFSSSDAHLWKS